MMDAISTRTIRSSQQDPSITSTTDQTKQNKTTKRINKIYGNILRRALFLLKSRKSRFIIFLVYLNIVKATGRLKKVNHI